MFDKVYNGVNKDYCVVIEKFVELDLVFEDMIIG